jgi:hypothetical protein
MQEVAELMGYDVAIEAMPVHKLKAANAAKASTQALRTGYSEEVHEVWICI